MNILIEGLAQTLMLHAGRMLRTLEERVHAWTGQLMRLTREHSAGVVAFGLDGEELMERCLADTQSRLKLAGL